MGCKKEVIMGRTRSVPEKIKAYKPDNPELFAFKIRMTRHWNKTIQYSKKYSTEKKLKFIEEQMNKFIENIKL
jgi:hypothetical protein